MNDIDTHKSKRLLEELLAIRENQLYELSQGISQYETRLKGMQQEYERYDSDVEDIQKILGVRYG